MNEQKLLGLGLVLIGLVAGTSLGVFVAVLPTSDPYTQQTVSTSYICYIINGTSIGCQGTHQTVFYQICIRSYWWGHLCRTYKTVES